MMDAVLLAESQAQRALSAPPWVEPALVVAIASDGSSCSVDCSGLTETAIPAADLTLAVGDPVLLARGRSRPYVVCRLPGAYFPPPVEVFVPPDRGTVTATAATTVTVSADGSSYVMPFLASYVPTVGDTVFIAWGDSGPVALGKPGTPPVPPTGVAASSNNAGTATVTWSSPASGTVTLYTIYASTGGSWSAGTDRVKTITGLPQGKSVRFRVRAIFTDGQAAYSAWSSFITIMATPPPTPPPPKPPPQTGTSTFNAIDARSFRNGKWRSDSAVVAQYDWGGYGTNYGAWFYGSGPSTLAGATVTGCRVRIRRRSGGVYAAQSAHIYEHTSRTRPGGNVAYTGSATDAAVSIGQAVWVTLPAAVGQHIVDSGHGLGIQGAPYVVLDGLDVYPQSGQIQIDWRR